MTLRPGWLQRQLRHAAVMNAISPEYMRVGDSDKSLTVSELKEAVQILRNRADELEKLSISKQCG